VKNEKPKKHRKFVPCPAWKLGSLEFAWSPAALSPVDLHKLLAYPGRAWTPEETLPATMLRWIAEQVSAAPSSFQGYAERDQTRREHFIELLNEYGWRSFGLHEHRELSTWLMNQARSTDQGMALVLLLIKIFQVRPETLSDLSRSIVFEAKSRFAFTLLPTINNQRKGVGEKTTCFGCLFV
jgi:uncharacterized protein DUF4158